VSLSSFNFCLAGPKTGTRVAVMKGLPTAATGGTTYSETTDQEKKQQTRKKLER
jgi:hypothetical protein